MIYNMTKENTLVVLSAVAVIAIVGIAFLVYQSQIPSQTGPTPQGSKTCTIDEDCVVFGESGDCNCGCYNKNNLPTATGEKCFCLAPVSCRCVNKKCEGIFEELSSFEECAEMGGVILESYPPQCRYAGETFVEDFCQDEEKNSMTISDAKEIAKASECGDKFLDNYHMCNENTGTWWIDLEIEKEGCSPACVVNIVTRKAEINWRCTGLIIP